MQCYRYFDEGAGVTRLGAFEDAGANQWRIFELELMPITNELLDFRIRFVPLVSLNRAFAQVVDNAGLLLHPIYVVYQPWFKDSTIVFREGSILFFSFFYLLCSVCYPVQLKHLGCHLQAR